MFIRILDESYLENAANMAIAGGCSAGVKKLQQDFDAYTHTISSLQDIWYEPRFVGMMEGGDGELELVR